jgi:hypothetical protein
MMIYENPQKPDRETNLAIYLETSMFFGCRSNQEFRFYAQCDRLNIVKTSDLN